MRAESTRRMRSRRETWRGCRGAMMAIAILVLIGLPSAPSTGSAANDRTSNPSDRAAATPSSAPTDPDRAAGAPSSRASGPARPQVSEGDRPEEDHALEDLEWMAGRWEGTSGKTAMEELWTDARGGLMLGLHRDVSTSGRVMFEFLRIVDEEAGIAYVASPMGRPPTRFPLASLDAAAKRVVFENPEHDFPQRIIYWLGDDARLHARVEGPQGGKESAMEWAWGRVE